MHADASSVIPLIAEPHLQFRDAQILKNWLRDAVIYF